MTNISRKLASVHSRWMFLRGWVFSSPLASYSRYFPTFYPLFTLSRETMESLTQITACKKCRQMCLTSTAASMTFLHQSQTISKHLTTLRRIETATSTYNNRFCIAGKMLRLLSKMNTMLTILQFPLYQSPVSPSITAHGDPRQSAPEAKGRQVDIYPRRGTSQAMLHSLCQYGA